MMRCPPERGRESVREGVVEEANKPACYQGNHIQLDNRGCWSCPVGLWVRGGGGRGFLISASQLYPSILLSFLLGLCDKQHKGNVTVESRPFQVRTSDRPFHASAKETQSHFQHANESRAQSSASVVFVHADKHTFLNCKVKSVLLNVSVYLVAFDLLKNGYSGRRFRHLSLLVLEEPAFHQK